MATNQPRKGKIILFGILFWYPLAGVTYQFLHYLIGLRKLGYDVYYVEDSGRWIYDPRINEFSPDVTGNLEMVVPVLNAHGFGDHWAFRGNLNVTGAQEIRDEHRAVKRRIYVESDPFASQVKVAKGDQGMIDMLAAHDTHFSFGENLGAPDCDAPIGQFKWLPTRQPVAVDLWNSPAPPDGTAYTTITTWHNKGKNLDWHGDTWYWTKDREFEKFLDLPRRRSLPFELATSVDEGVRRHLLDNGWRQSGSVEISRDADLYRKYIQGSRGEFTVARDQYVRPNTGWFSDRTACYLAAGRPVITQETGFSKFIPSGHGLFAFRTMDDILAAVDAIESNYPDHCCSASEIASEYFSAEKVVGSLMERAGL
jgi:hypothetical protein